MINIRPVWNPSFPAHGELRKEVLALLEVENRIVKASDVFLNLIRVLVDEDYVDELSSLSKSAHNDLIGGCEMARTGYVKQAYSLWRSWFEQSIFFLYFLEAPIHKAAWQVKAEISQDDSPQYRLMLHQLLSNTSEKHPFALVYDSRYKILSEALKISGVSKANHPIQKASRVLTTLSQGVHGTYQPQSAKDLDGVCVQLEANCTPVLSAAEEILDIFWILLITELVALPPEVLISFREGSSPLDRLNDAGLDNVDKLATIAPFFAIAFPSPKKQNG
jgi:hypothetical protein